VDAEVEACLEGWESDEPGCEEVAGVEGVVEEAGEIEEEVVAEAVGLIDDEDWNDGLVIDQAGQGLFELAPEGISTKAGLEAEDGCEVSIDRSWGDRGIAEVEDLVFGCR